MKDKLGNKASRFVDKFHMKFDHMLDKSALI
jgi:hypothetical protein